MSEKTGLHPEDQKVLYNRTGSATPRNSSTWSASGTDPR
jgi:hypothetical protein